MGWRASLVVLIWVLVAAPASGATRVASDGKLALFAVQKQGRMCVTLKKSGRYHGRACGRVPRSGQRPLTIFPDVGYGTYAAAVASTVRVAELEQPGGGRTRHETVAARAFTARFVVVKAPPIARLVRYYAADGALVGADGGPGGYISEANRTLVFGTRENGVEATTSDVLAPTPRSPDRLRSRACVSVVNVSGGNTVCDDAGPGLLELSACRGRDLVAGIVPAEFASVRLTLGDGTELAVPTNALPAPFGGRRTVAARVPAGMAVRSAAAFDSAGTQIAGVTVGSPPGGQGCSDTTEARGEFEGAFVPAVAPAGAVVAEAAGQSLLVGDDGETLCPGIGALAARVCPSAPVDSDLPHLLRRGETVAGVLGADAARVTLRLDRGPDVTVPTTAGPAYTGTWAGAVRFFAAAVPAGRDVTGATVRAADGTVVGVNTRGAAARPVRFRTLAARGGVGVRLRRHFRDQPCVEAFPATLAPAPRFCTDPNPGTQIDGPYLPVGGAVVVGCAPRRAIAYGRLDPGQPPPRIELRGGRTLRATRIRLAYDDAWVAFLPDTAVTGMRSDEHHLRLHLPAPGAQCGYTLHVAF